MFIIEELKAKRLKVSSQLNIIVDQIEKEVIKESTIVHKALECT
jgi:predicted transcriptional regulator